MATRTKPRYQTLQAYVESHPRTVTQGAIAKKLGLTETTLSSYLSGRRKPGPVRALRLHREFGISLEGLLEGSTV